MKTLLEKILTIYCKFLDLHYYDCQLAANLPLFLVRRGKNKNNVLLFKLGKGNKLK